MATRRPTGEELQEYKQQLQALIEQASNLNATIKASLEGLPNLEQHFAETKSFVERNRADAQTQIEQHRADAQAQIDQHRADAQTQISQHRADAQAQISQRSADAQAQIDQHLTDARSHAQSAQSHAEAAQSHNATANNEAQEIERIKSASQGSKDAIEEIASDARNYHEAVAKMHNEIGEHSANLDSLIETAGDLTNEVEGLLPGATSASLATAFRERRLMVARPKNGWFLILVASLAGLLVGAILDPQSLKLIDPSLAGLSGYLLSRLPFALPFVWLALYAGKRHSQALRLEEEYAHKEVLSQSFEGYKKQISELEGRESGNAQTLHLIRKTIDALSRRPGRIYQGKRDEGHPIWSLIRPSKRPNGAD